MDGFFNIHMLIDKLEGEMKLKALKLKRNPKPDNIKEVKDSGENPKVWVNIFSSI